MLGNQAVDGFVPGSAGTPSAFDVGADVLPPPDPAVVDDARLRISAHRVLSAGQPLRQALLRRVEDIRAIHAVIDSAGGDAPRSADVLDVGAALVVLCDLRLYLDGLEADLLDAAQQVGLGWDVIAAIVGIPADEAQVRHRALRARQGSP